MSLFLTLVPATILFDGALSPALRAVIAAQPIPLQVIEIMLVARDRNFAVHLPVLGRLFGTYYAPRGQWPTGYGLSDETMPEGYFEQTVWLFVRRTT